MRVKFLQKVIWSIVLTSVLGFYSSYASAMTFPLPAKGEAVIGKIQTTVAREGEDLGMVGRRFEVGLNEMIRANPGVKAKGPVSGQELVIPSQHILPPGPREGIVINLAELRLYYYPKNEKVVITEPVGIGREGRATPEGTTHITMKIKDPEWRPTPQVRADAEELGYYLPRVVAPGPENPLGKYAMMLGWKTYLIHGTNRPDGVGLRISAGCIRMFPEDIDELFTKVPLGTSVRVINQPIKLGWSQQKLYLEAHKPLQESEAETEAKLDTVGIVNSVMDAIKKRQALIKWSAAKTAADQQSGIPDVVGILVE